MPCSSCSSINVVARGLCLACYHRQRRNGSVARKNVPNIGRECNVDGCAKAATAKGLCGAHYQQQLHPLRNTWKLLRGRYPGQWPPHWAEFDAFLADVGERPGRHHQLRRADDTKPYSAANVRWVKPVAARKDYYTKDQRAEYVREWGLRRFYNITGDEFASLLAKQDGGCAICDDKAKLHVDHCHSGGAVRGLLCGHCNRLLGSAKDKVSTLRRAIAYLERHQK